MGQAYSLEITSSCKAPEIAIRWADEIYDPLMGLQRMVEIYQTVYNRYMGK
jgi:hypothetical protein